MDIPEIADARRLRLRPGDVLALRFECPPDEEDAEFIRARIAEIFGWPVPLMILEAGTEIAVVGPASDDEAVRPVTLTLQVDGSSGDEFVRWMRRYIRRHGGGDVQKALGS